MATTYDFVSQNKLKSFLLIALFITFVGLLGWFVGAWTDFGISGLVFALIIAIAMTLGGYFAGDKLALAVARATGPLTKDQNPYLYNLVENLCLTAGLPRPKIYVIADPAINAFATGRDPLHASMAVTTGAIEKLENEELEGVVAHELSHIRNYDVRLMMLVLVLVNVVILLARWWFSAGRIGQRRSGDRGNIGGLFALVGLVLLILSPLIAQLIQLAVSRRREFLADAAGALLTRYPAGLASALQKIGTENTRPMVAANEATAHLYFDTPFGRSGRSLAKLFMSHPPIEERIAALRKMER